MAVTLPQAEELLLNRNLAVAASRNQVEIADAARAIAGLRPNPNLRVGADQTPIYMHPNGLGPSLLKTSPDGAANPTYTVEVGQLFERGGKRQLRREVADAVVEVTKAQSLDTFRQQLLELRQAFTTGLLAKANLQLAREADEQYSETEKLMEIRLRGGEIAEVDLERVKAARLPYLQAVLDTQLAYQQSLRQISALLGMGTAGISQLEGDLVEKADVPPLPRLREIALAERPDLQSTQFNLRASEKNLRLSEALRKRDVYGSMLAQRSGQDYAVGVSVSIPLFVYNNQKGYIAQAAAQERLAATQLRQAAVQVESDVDRAYQAVETARQTMELFSREAITRSRSIRSTIIYSYQRGEADLLEVFDAQRSANQILTGYNQARANYMNAVAQLQNAIGRSF